MWPTSIAVCTRSVPPHSGHASPAWPGGCRRTSARSRARPGRRGDASPSSFAPATYWPVAERLVGDRPRRRPRRARASRRRRRTRRGSRRPSAGRNAASNNVSSFSGLSRSSPRTSASTSRSPVTTGSAFGSPSPAMPRSVRDLLDRRDARRLHRLRRVERRRQVGAARLPARSLGVGEVVAVLAAHQLVLARACRREEAERALAAHRSPTPPRRGTPRARSARRSARTPSRAS